MVVLHILGGTWKYHILLLQKFANCQNSQENKLSSDNEGED